MMESGYCLEQFKFKNSIFAVIHLTQLNQNQLVWVVNPEVLLTCHARFCERQLECSGGVSLVPDGEELLEDSRL
jgi:hypothetical protein